MTHTTINDDKRLWAIGGYVGVRMRGTAHMVSLQPKQCNALHLQYNDHNMHYNTIQYARKNNWVGAHC